MKTYWGVVSFIPQSLYPQYLLNGRLSGPQSHSGHRGEEKNSQPLPGIKIIPYE